MSIVMPSIIMEMAAGVLGMLLLGVPAAAAEKWLKVMPNDPFSNDGSFHQFDIDSAFEDSKTGLVAARLIYAKPASGEPVTSWFVWAFDCKKNTVYYVSDPGDTGTTVKAGWHDKPNRLKKPVMGGVTNMLGKKLCALKGSWPQGDLPVAPPATP